MTSISPNKIVGGFNRRDPRAVEWIYDEYYPEVFSTVLKLVGQQSPDLNDLVAEVFLRLLKSTGRFDRLAKIRSYLFNAARNLSVDWLRHQQILRQREADLKIPEIDESDAYADRPMIETFMTQIYQALTKVPEPYNRVLTLTYIYGMRNDQIAALLRISKKTVANKRILAMEKLKEILKKGGLLILLNFLS